MQTEPGLAPGFLLSFYSWFTHPILPAGSPHFSISRVIPVFIIQVARAATKTNRKDVIGAAGPRGPTALRELPKWKIPIWWFELHGTTVEIEAPTEGEAIAKASEIAANPRGNPWGNTFSCYGAAGVDDPEAIG